MKRAVRSAWEQDALTGWRHYFKWHPGVRKSIKRRANRRDRADARRAIRREDGAE